MGVMKRLAKLNHDLKAMTIDGFFKIAFILTEPNGQGQKCIHQKYPS